MTDGEFRRKEAFGCLQVDLNLFSHFQTHKVEINDHGNCSYKNEVHSVSVISLILLCICRLCCRC